MAEVAPNPLVDIWSSASATFRRLEREHPDALCVGVSALGGVADIVSRLAVGARGPINLSGTAGLLIVLGLAWGAVRTYAWALVSWPIASALGGHGTYLATSRAFIWGALPGAATLLMWVPAWLLLGPELFALHLHAASGEGGALLLFAPIVLVMSAAIVWGLVQLIRHVGRAHELSFGRASAAVLLGPLLASVIVMSFVMLFS